MSYHCETTGSHGVRGGSSSLQRLGALDLYEAEKILLKSLVSLGPCNHEAGVCTGACTIIDKLHDLRTRQPQEPPP
jgi:hypothetical protein